MYRLVEQHPVIALAGRSAGLLWEGFEVMSVGEKEVGVHQRSDGQRHSGLTKPPLEALEVVKVFGDGGVLPAVLLQDGEEVLLDFAKRRRWICGLVHVEAPCASAGLV
jgi:hypothetical protein